MQSAEPLVKPQPTCSIADLQALARGRLGLIIGPSATTADASWWLTARAELAKCAQVDAHGAYHETAETALAGGTEYETVRDALALAASSAPPSPLLSQLAKIRWTAVISGAIDDHFETRVEQEHLRRPARTDVTVLSSPEQIARAGTLPIYKLLGSATRRDVAVTTADILRRLAGLAPICRDFTEHVKASPVLCIGMDGAPWLLGPLLAQLFAQRGGGPATLVFLADDPLTSSATIRQLVPAHALVLASGGTLDVAKAIEPVLANRQTILNFREAPDKPKTVDLTEFADLFVPLDADTKPSIQASERERLLDYLFMPDIPNWDPLMHGYDFRRTLSATICRDIRSYSEAEPATFVLHGRAGSGKTTVLKRAALDLAQTGHLVCWMKDYWYGDVAGRVDKLLTRLGPMLTDRALTIAIDASSSTISEPFAAFLRSSERAKIAARIVLCVRTSDLQPLERELHEAGVSPTEVWDLDDSLDATEWAALPDYLAQIGVSSDVAAAHALVRQAEQRKHTRDTLALLYWLLPQTRQMIAQSVQQEYVTLGDAGRVTDIVKGLVGGSTATLKDAYGMVAVSSRYGASLPIEILTSALGVPYAEWLDSIGERGPAWGLFYPADDIDLEGAAYRTRNEVVTDILLRAINGGVVSRAGEVAILQRLLAACSGTNPIYMKYCERMLVRNKALDGLSLAEGTSLYTAADSALPFKSRAILHHKGRWIRKHGGDIDEALRALDEALVAEPAPYSDRTEADEHIHTSKAVAILQKLDQRKISYEDAKREALLELEKSRSPHFVNPHATHAYASVASRLAFGRGALDEVDRFDLVNRALADLDRMTILIQSGGLRRRSAHNDLEFLETARTDIISKCVSTEEDAEALWESRKNPIGFAVATRRRIAPAIGRSDAGTTFKEAFDYWSTAKMKIEKAGIDIGPEFSEVGLLLYYTWQVDTRSRKRIRSNTSPVRWELLRDLSERTLQSKRFQRDPFYRFVYGLCLSHFKEWPAADLTFAENRKLNLPNEILHAPRAYLLHPEGTPWKLQGNLKPGASGNYFDAVDLRRQFVASKYEDWPKGSAQLHAYIVFSFAGPRATLSEDLCRSAVFLDY